VVKAVGDDASVQIDCNGILLAAQSHQVLAVGQPVTAAFRYERLKIVPTDDPSAFASGRVVERVYLGQSTRLAVALANGAILTADLQDPPERSVVSQNDRVSLAVRPQSVAALTE
jgi:ABC-type Fe3+/spermidine/putrescine transport system ATPase subunit